MRRLRSLRHGLPPRRHPHEGRAARGLRRHARRGALDTKPFRARGLDHNLLTIQVAPDDCTGCAICVDVCPAHAKDDPTHKALAMVDAELRRDLERPRWEAFLALPEVPRARWPTTP